MQKQEYTKLSVIFEADFERFRLVRKSRSMLLTFLLHRGFRFTFIMRLVAYMRWHPFWRYFSILGVIPYYWMQTLYNTQISYGTRIGSGFYLPHTGGIVVNPATKIGKNCYFSHNVTIGKVHAGKKQGVPTLGDDVFIGAGAVILGNITVGNNAAIGPNSVVINDVPDNAYVGGVPAKVISDKGAREILGRDRSNG